MARNEVMFQFMTLLLPNNFGAFRLGLLYLGSLSILYGLTAKESNWLGAVTSAAMIFLDMAEHCELYGFHTLVVTAFRVK
ncbi:hypothetical protein C5167_023347 [Papaver somniferum]|uniref:Uncharacterized protein n=1 Tax=Papaver somniferum TaxID=3469 RepID=A0A4Y7JPJ5_PAPSO|nr:hypothetical protein C5167_023347 [Papaver somniferum]